MRRSISRLVHASLAFAALGCGTASDSSSSGVETWTVSEAPALSIGADSSDNLDASFERLTGATRLADGRLIVADLGDAPLRLFAEDGRFIRRLARKGQGPGEVEYLAVLYRCGDLLFSYDIDGHRVAQWTLEGVFEREFRFQVPAGQQVPYVSACNATGRFAHLGWGDLTAPLAGYHRDTVPLWTTAAADAAPTLLDSVPASERWGRVIDGRVVGTRPLPFGKQPRIGIGADRIYVATGDADGIRVYDLSGAPLARIAVADSAPAVTPQDLRDIVEREILEDGESRRRAIEREYAEITYPTTKGNVSAMLVDAEGLLWMRPPVPASSTRVQWQVFGSDGTPRANISLPAALEVLEVGRDYVLGRMVDTAAGVPLLQLYGLAGRVP